MVEQGKPWAEATLSLPPLSPDAVQVWRLLLDPHAIERTLVRAADVLSAEEKKRAAGMRIADARVEFMAGRSLMRTLLGQALQTHPRNVRLHDGPLGKPSVDSAQDVEFNLSHSRGLIVLALGLGTPIGIDVEFVDEDFAEDDEWMRMAHDCFEAEDILRLSQISAGPHRALAFYRQWVRKEALAKLQGRGLAPPLIPARGSADEEDQTRTGADHAEVIVQPLPVEPDHVGAIATTGVRHALAFYDAAPLLERLATT